MAAIGVVMAFIGLWIAALTGSKYWDDGTFGTLVLILAIVAGLLVLGALATNNRALDVAAGAVGGVIFGLYLWYPAVFAFDQWQYLDSGAWLGVCSGLIVIGAALAVGPGLLAGGGALAPLGILLALAGLVLVVVGIWTRAADTLGKYWDVTGAGHSLGILLLILVVLTALAIGAAYAGAVSSDLAVGLAAVTAGLTIYLPVIAAFNQFGHLRVGGWLAAVGGLLLLAGALAMRPWAPAAAPAAVQPPPSAPPPPA